MGIDFESDSGSTERPLRDQRHGEPTEAPERPDPEQVKADQVSAVEEEREYHNRRMRGELTDEEKANTVLSPEHEETVLRPEPGVQNTTPDQE